MRRLVLAMTVAAGMSWHHHACAEELTFRIRSEHPDLVELAFYAQGRAAAWPGNGRSYSIADYAVHSYKLTCRAGETVCYGAWLSGNEATYWGSGFDGKKFCRSCCFTCDGSVTTILTLTR